MNKYKRKKFIKYLTDIQLDRNNVNRYEEVLSMKASGVFTKINGDNIVLLSSTPVIANGVDIKFFDFTIDATVQEFTKLFYDNLFLDKNNCTYRTFSNNIQLFEERNYISEPSENEGYIYADRYITNNFEYIETENGLKIDCNMVDIKLILQNRLYNFIECKKLIQKFSYIFVSSLLSGYCDKNSECLRTTNILINDPDVLMGSSLQYEEPTEPI